MRNVIAHEYGDVDYDLLWHTMSASVPQFAASLGEDLRFPLNRRSRGCCRRCI